MRLLAALGLVLAGAATGLATVALHDLAGWLALALVATAVTTFALPPGWWTRPPFALGWVGLVGWLTVPRPEGDYVISQDWQGYAVLAAAVVLVVVALGTLPRPRRRAVTPDP